MSFDTLVVNKSGVELSYTDSGAPSKSPYTTMFAIHGMCFSNVIFEKLKFEAFAKGTRLVAINRRSYPGSTPLSSDELNIIMNGGSDQQKDSEIEARGHEIASFINNFIEKESLPTISRDGKTGGVILLGWSLGAAFALAAVSSCFTLPEDTRSHFTSQLRTVIAYDAAPSVLGLPSPEQNWAPLIDTTIPENLRLPAFGQWVTGYFDHGDFSKHDHSTVSWVLPATDQIPTVFNIPSDKLKEIQCYGTDSGLADLFLILQFADQLKSYYRKAFYDPETYQLFPRMNNVFLCGERSGSYGITGLWAAQDDNNENGGEMPITFKIMQGANHFLHWDNPERAFEFFMA